MIVGKAGPPNGGVNGFILPQTSAYKIRIRTDSADSNGLMLFDDGELVAILVELADESHGDIRGQWAIESTFGLNSGQPHRTFSSAEDAATWIGQHICQRPFALSQDLVELQ